MKTKLNRFICAVLSVVLLIAAVPTAAFAEENAPTEWTYYNSIEVTVSVNIEKNFDVSDFPEVLCTSVITAKKVKTDSGFIYNLILVMENSGENAVKEAMDAVSENALVTNVGRNSFVDNYAKCATEMSLNSSSIFLPIGKKVDLQIDHVVLVEQKDVCFGIDFTIDPAIIKDDTLNKDSFAQYGICRFWPNSEATNKKEIDNHLYYQGSSGVEGTRSEIDNYFGQINSEKNYVEIVDQLAKTPGVVSACIVYELLPPAGIPPYEDWTLSNEDVASIVLSGGKIANGFNENGPKLNQIATVTGLKPGETIVSVEHCENCVVAEASCTVNVYLPGDVNLNGKVNADDALLALQNAVGKITLDENKSEFHAADISENGVIETIDALHILQMAVGKR